MRPIIAVFIARRRRAQRAAWLRRARIPTDDAFAWHARAWTNTS